LISHFLATKRVSGGPAGFPWKADSPAARLSKTLITNTLNSSAVLPLKVLMPFKKKNIGTLWNLNNHLLRQNPPEPHKVSALEPSGTSPRILT